MDYLLIYFLFFFIFYFCFQNLKAKIENSIWLLVFIFGTRHKFWKVEKNKHTPEMVLIFLHSIPFLFLHPPNIFIFHFLHKNPNLDLAKPNLAFASVLFFFSFLFSLSLLSLWIRIILSISIELLYIYLFIYQINIQSQYSTFKQKWIIKQIVQIKEKKLNFRATAKLHMCIYRNRIARIPLWKLCK